MSESHLIDSYAARRRKEVEDWAQELLQNREPAKAPGAPVPTPATQQPKPGEDRGFLQGVADAIIPPDPSQGNYAQQLTGAVGDRFYQGVQQYQKALSGTSEPFRITREKQRGLGDLVTGQEPERETVFESPALGTVRDSAMGLFNMMFPFGAAAGKMTGDFDEWLGGKTGKFDEALTDESLRRTLDSLQRLGDDVAWRDDAIKEVESLLSTPHKERVERVRAESRAVAETAGEVLGGAIPGYTLVARAFTAPFRGAQAAAGAAARGAVGAMAEEAVRTGPRALPPGEPFRQPGTGAVVSPGIVSEPGAPAPKALPVPRLGERIDPLGQQLPSGPTQPGTGAIIAPGEFQRALPPGPEPLKALPPAPAEAAEVSARPILEQAGARFDGVTDGLNGRPMVWYTDPNTGSTGLIYADELTGPEVIAERMARSREEFARAAAEAESRGVVPARRVLEPEIVEPGMAPGAPAGDDALRRAVLEARGEWVGVEDGVVHFADPETGTPLSLPVADVNEANVLRAMNDARKQAGLPELEPAPYEIDAPEFRESFGMGAKVLPEDAALRHIASTEEATRNVESFQRFLQRGEYAILSAEKSHLTPAENAARTAELRALLSERGYAPIPAKGRYVGADENSLIVPGLPEAEALELARQFDQESVLSPRGLIFTADESVAPANLSKIDFSGAQADNFTDVEIAGQRVRFTIPIDFGEEPAEQALRLTHFSNEGELAVIDPAKFGTGQAGREARRSSEKGFLPRSYFYEEGAKVEARFRGAPYQYTVEVPSSRIYDIGTDPLGLYARAAKEAASQPMSPSTRLEQLIQEAGFDGYRNSSPEAAPAGVVAMFKKTVPVDVQLHGGMIEHAAPEFEAAKLRLKKEWEEFRARLSSEGGAFALRGSLTEGARKNRQLWNDLQIVGAGYIWAGYRSFAKWAEAMVARFGQEIAPLLKELFPEAQKRHSKMLKKHPNLATYERVWNLTRKGEYRADWYDEAYEEAVRELGPNADLYLQVYAALSPRTAADTSNFTFANRAFTMILNGEVGDGVWFTKEHGFMDAHRQNLNRILRGEPLSGPKVGEFYPALKGDRNANVIDTWEARLYGFSKKNQKTGEWSDPSLKAGDERTTWMKNGNVMLARDLGIDVRQAQAAHWIAFTEIEKGLDPGAQKSWREMFRHWVKELPDEFRAQFPDTAKQIDDAPSWVTEDGKINTAMAAVMARTVVAGFVGSLTGDDPESAMRNALIAAGIGSVLSARVARSLLTTMTDTRAAHVLTDAFKDVKSLQSETGAIRFPHRSVGKKPSPNTDRMGASVGAKRIVRGINEKLLEARKLSRGYTVSHDETIEAALRSKYRNIDEVLKLDLAKLSLDELPAVRTAARGVRDFVLEDVIETYARAALNNDAALMAEGRQKFLLAGKVSQRVTDMETWIARAQEAGRITSDSRLAGEWDMNKLARELGDMEAALTKGVDDATLMKMVTEASDRARTEALAKAASKYPQALWNIYYGLNLLSSPVTHTKNILGNMVGLTMAVGDRFLGEIVATPFRIVGAGSAHVVPLEAYEQLSGIVSTIADSWRAAKRGVEAFGEGATRREKFSLMIQEASRGDSALSSALNTARTGKSNFGVVTKESERLRFLAAKSLDAKDGAQQLPRIIDVMDKAAQANLRFMSGTDEFFKVLSFQAEIRSLARRKVRLDPEWSKMTRAQRKDAIQRLIDDPDADMLKQAFEYAHENTFTKAFDRDSFGGTLERLSKFPIARVLIAPFYRTPVRLTEFSLNHTPVLNMLSKQFYSDMAGAGSNAVKRELALAKIASGVGITTVVGWYAAHGYITGDWPDDPALRRRYQEMGWKPYSIYNPWTQKYHSYRGIEPIASIMGGVANFVQMAPYLKDDHLLAYGSALVLGFSNSLKDIPYYQGVSDIIDAIEASDRGDNVDAVLAWAGKRASSFVPGAAVLRNVSRSTDDVERERKTVTDDPNVPPELREVEVVRNFFREMVPVWSKTRPVIRNLVTGEPLPREGGWFGALFPWQVSELKNDRVLNELVQLGGAGLPAEVPRVLGGNKPSNSIVIRDGDKRAGVLLSDKERAELGDLISTRKNALGQTLYQALDDLMFGSQKDWYNDQPDEVKSLEVKRTFRSFFEDAEEEFLRRHPGIANVIEQRELERELGRLPHSMEDMADPMRDVLQQMQEAR